jgi:hypothetical protein
LNAVEAKSQDMLAEANAPDALAQNPPEAT